MASGSSFGSSTSSSFSAIIACTSRAPAKIDRVVPALVASVFSAVIYNLWIVLPLSTFSVPTAGEIIYMAIKVVASIFDPVDAQEDFRAQTICGLRPYSQHLVAISRVPLPPGNPTACCGRPSLSMRSFLIAPAAAS